MNLNKIELKGVKLHNTMDGTAFVANIYLDGNKIGAVQQDGNGGPNLYNFNNHQIRIDFMDSCKERYKEDYESEDIFIYDLLDKQENAKWIKRQCKNKTLFRLVGDENGLWHTIATPFTPNVKIHLTNKYGNKLEEIANETRL